MSSQQPQPSYIDEQRRRFASNGLWTRSGYDPPYEGNPNAKQTRKKCSSGMT
jgi:hypothetical protein